MLHACVAKFNVIKNLKKNWKLNHTLAHAART